MKRIRRYLSVLAGLAGTALAMGAAAPAALAYPPPPEPVGAAVTPPPPASLPGQVVVAGGMPGWQIALIAIGAALFAAALAVLADRAWTARRRVTTAG
jgi:hypothetical protein